MPSSSAPSLSQAKAPAVLSAQPLGFPWATQDPFLFCAFHDDAYPAGNPEKGPVASLQGRDLGQDFSRKDGWSMYHGEQVPGFPSHPHRGFETVTIVRKGLIDHSDSLGAAARFGGGDVQWLTAGKGIVHSEMFPLLRQDAANPLELFQIWLNLPARSKMTDPYFTMLWRDQIPRQTHLDAAGKITRIDVVAGPLQTRDGNVQPLAPPPNSWAAEDDSDVAIWTLSMQPGARWTLPAATGAKTRRSLYFFRGDSVLIDGQRLAQHAVLEIDAGQDIELIGGDLEAEFLLLQGKPIAEPVVQHGPFVMNTAGEIRQAIADYQRTGFGGWPWPDSGPVHGDELKRFARHPDGKKEVVAD